MVIFLSILVVLMTVLLALLAIKVFKMKEQLKPKPRLTKEEKKKLEEAKKAFDNLMKYDYDEAMKRK